MNGNRKVLLVEDDENLGFVVKDNLEMLDYEVSLAKDGQEAQKMFFNNEYHLILLDVMLPKIDGFELAGEFKAAHPSIPIMFLTAKSMKNDKIAGFKLGGDDYITKPFSIEELQLRIEALMKRVYDSKQEPEAVRIFHIGDYLYDYENLVLRKDGEEQTLTQKEGEVLRLLCVKKNQVLKRERALEVIWGENDYFAGRSMDVYISKLRKYLAGDERVKIENVHGVGFRLSIAE